ncbi:MAG: hypothetical protein MJA27_03735 [Pseudanabaenales cyanobacterium]|nr:hypothetical protein [Pseudanabaenales cyanobacterium]
MFKAAIAEPIPIDYAEKVDFGFFLINVWEDLINHNQVDECLALVTTLQQQQPDLYQREFQYLDDLLVKYHLFHHQIDAVRNDLSRFQANPVEGIDQLSAVLDDLQFYGATEPLVDFCRAVYQPIAQSRKVFDGVETEFGDIVIFDQFENVYQQLQQGETIDWEAFKTEAIQYGLADNASQWTEIEHNLTVDVETGDKFAQRFKRNPSAVLRHLLLNFCRHMRTQHHMSFVRSQEEEITIEPSAKSPQNQPTAEAEPTPPAQQPAWEPPKPGKSPLQEAKGLTKSKSKRSGKKKSGQGFN